MDTHSTTSLGFSWFREQHGLPPVPNDFFGHILGKPLSFSLGVLLGIDPTAEENAQLLAKECAEFRARQLQIFDNTPVEQLVFPGVLKALHVLKQNGKRLAIISSRSVTACEHLLTRAALRSCFDVVQFFIFSLH